MFNFGNATYSQFCKIIDKVILTLYKFIFLML